MERIYEVRLKGPRGKEMGLRVLIPVDQSGESHLPGWLAFALAFYSTAQPHQLEMDFIFNIYLAVLGLSCGMQDLLVVA